MCRRPRRRLSQHGVTFGIAQRALEQFRFRRSSSRARTNPGTTGDVDPGLPCCASIVQPLSLERLAFEKAFQDECAVVILVARRIDQSHAAFARLLLEEAQRAGLVLKLSSVAFLEPLPFREVMVEPFSQPGARCHVLEPEIELRPLLGHAARPKPLNQNPKTVRSRRLLIGALQPEHGKLLCVFANLCTVAAKVVPQAQRRPITQRVNLIAFRPCSASTWLTNFAWSFAKG